MSSLSQLDGQLPTLRLQEWAEPGPSTPPRHAVAHAENWDDDFEGKSKSPAHQSPPRSHPNHKLPRLPDIPEPENWDDDLDANRAIKACHRHHDHHDHHLRRRHLRRLRSKYLNSHHAAMTSMLHMQLASVQAAFATKRRHFACLRDVLDEATEQLTTET